jgi:hypothetical protein
MVEFCETERTEDKMNKCLTCGYEAEQGPECVGCMVARMEREGNEIAEQAELAQEERFASDLADLDRRF